MDTNRVEDVLIASRDRLRSNGKVSEAEANLAKEIVVEALRKFGVHERQIDFVEGQISFAMEWQRSG